MKEKKNKKKWYGVQEGRKTGIFETWAECKEQIHKYPGAKYKSFATLEQAQVYMGTKLPALPEEVWGDDLAIYCAIANYGSKKFYYGISAVYKGKQKLYAGPITDSEYIASDIPGAFMCCVVQATAFSDRIREHYGISEVYIYTDNDSAINALQVGVKTKVEVADRYREDMRKYGRNLEVHVLKYKPEYHSNIFMYDAKRCARSALWRTLPHKQNPFKK